MAKKTRKKKIKAPEETEFYTSLLKQTLSLYRIENGKLRDNYSQLEVYHKEVLEIALRITAILGSLNHSRIFIQSIRTKRINRKTEPTDAQFLRYHLECYAIRVVTYKDVYLKLLNRVFRLGVKENIGLEKNIASIAEKNKLEIITSLLEGLNIIVQQLEPQRHRIVHGSYHDNLNLIMLESLETRFDKKEMPRIEMKEYKTIRELLISENAAEMFMIGYMMQTFMITTFNILLPIKEEFEKLMRK